MLFPKEFVTIKELKHKDYFLFEFDWKKDVIVISKVTK